MKTTVIVYALAALCLASVVWCVGSACVARLWRRWEADHDRLAERIKGANDGE